MNLLLEGPLVVRCEKCGKRILFKSEWFEEEISGSSRERGMGYDTEHIFSLETKCPRCQSELYVSYSVLEYPMGAIDSYYDYCRGCTVEDYPGATIDYRFEFNEFEENEICSIVQDDYFELQQIIDDPELLYRVKDRKFEEIVAEVFINLGYEVELTKQTRDGGRDVIATKCVDGLTYMIVIECKHYNPNRKVSVSLIRELSAVRNDNKANKALLVTSSSFTKDARKYADESNSLIELIDFNKLIEMIKRAEEK